MTFEEYVQKHLGVSGMSYEDMELVGLGWAAHRDHGSCSEIPNSSDHIADAGEMVGSRQALDGEPVAVVDRVGIMQRLSPYTNLPEGTKLYIHPASAVPDSEYVRALQDACDIIQADANTEENYASLCRIGAALVKLRAAPDKADEQVSVPERIKCSERMPSKEDADCDSAVWVSDCAFHRPKYAQKRVHWETVSEVAEYTHWKSTGLARPQPPKQEQGK
jgi:hypothetical protein